MKSNESMFPFSKNRPLSGDVRIRDGFTVKVRLKTFLRNNSIRVRSTETEIM